MDLQHLEKKPRFKQVTYTTFDGEEVSTQVIILPALMAGVPAQAGRARLRPVGGRRRPTRDPRRQGGPG